MAHQQNGVRIIADVALEPDRAFKIEIVGGLVEQQHIGRAKQRRRQGNAHAPAAGQRRAGAILRLFAEAEARQDDGGPGRGRMGLDIGQPDLDFRNAVRIGRRFGLGEQGFPLLVAGHDRIEQAFGPARRFLRHRADAGIVAARWPSPTSEISSPRMSFKSVDLPVPLRPTRPTLWPSGRAGRGPLKQEPSADSEGEIVDM